MSARGRARGRGNPGGGRGVVVPVTHDAPLLSPVAPEIVSQWVELRGTDDVALMQLVVVNGNYFLTETEMFGRAKICCRNAIFGGA